MNLFENAELRWKHYTGKTQFDHPISYWGAVLDGREDGHVDLLYRWDANSACQLRGTSFSRLRLTANAIVPVYASAQCPSASLAQSPSASVFW